MEKPCKTVEVGLSGNAFNTTAAQALLCRHLCECQLLNSWWQQQQTMFGLQALLLSHPEHWSNLLLTLCGLARVCHKAFSEHPNAVKCVCKVHHTFIMVSMALLCLGFV